ncbi:MAG: hypothetical protein ACI9FN_000254 [Saprospiraceae bacterium]
MNEKKRSFSLFLDVFVNYYRIFAPSMRSSSAFFFIVFYGIYCVAQTGNPFDIGPASESSQKVIVQDSSVDAHDIQGVEVNVPVISNNPFDINSEGRQIDSSVVKTNIESSKEAKTPAVDGNKKPSEIITLIYIIAVLCLLTFAINLNRTRFTALLKSLFNSNFLKNLYKDNRAWTDLQSILLYGLFLTNSAYLLYLLNYHYFSGRLPSVFIIFIVVLALYLLRHFTMVFISYVYGLGQEVDLHNFSIGIHNMILGIVFIPFILGYGFVAPVVAKVVLVLLCVSVFIFYAFRQIKGGLSIITSRDFNAFYFFIYLCSVEIAPILITWKVVSGVL